MEEEVVRPRRLFQGHAGAGMAAGCVFPVSPQAPPSQGGQAKTGAILLCRAYLFYLSR